MNVLRNFCGISQEIPGKICVAFNEEDFRINCWKMFWKKPWRNIQENVQRSLPKFPKVFVNGHLKKILEDFWKTVSAEFVKESLEGFFFIFLKEISIGISETNPGGIWEGSLGIFLFFFKEFLNPSLSHSSCFFFIFWTQKIGKLVNSSHTFSHMQQDMLSY